MVVVGVCWCRLVSVGVCWLLLVAVGWCRRAVGVALLLLGLADAIQSVEMTYLTLRMLTAAAPQSTAAAVAPSVCS